jgi:RimJ/RimL family protein N-acetyltransferase
MINIFKGKKIQLRNVQAEDADLIVALPIETEVTSFAGGFVELPRGPVEPVRNFFANMATRNTSDDSGNCKLAIETLEEGKWVGTVGLHNSNRRIRAAELDIWISPSGEFGKGYGKEACLILLNYAFNEMDFQRIGLGVYDINARAVELYRNLGFVEEGRFRRNYFYRGEFHDEIRMSILREEFMSQHRDFVDFLYSDR